MKSRISNSLSQEDMMIQSLRTISAIRAIDFHPFTHHGMDILNEQTTATMNERMTIASARKYDLTSSQLFARQRRLPGAFRDCFQVVKVPFLRIARVVNLAVLAAAIQCEVLRQVVAGLNLLLLEIDLFRLR